jgi:predicted transposase YbfD/YdcC
MPLALKKTCRLMVESGNHYLGALKGNQGNLHKSVQAHFVAERVIPTSARGMGGLNTGR